MTAQQAHEALAGVMDPEIPTLSIVDLGMVEEVSLEGGHVHVALLPTFLGCPALDLIEEAVRKAIPDAVVTFRHDPPWSTDRITEAGKEALRRFGIAPPGEGEPSCPRCGGHDVLAENLFGPTKCRAIYYCRACRAPFEAFKAI